MIWKKICKTKAKAWKTFQLEVFEQSAILSAIAEAFVAPVAVPWISPKHSGTKNCICTTPSPCRMSNGATKICIAVSPMLLQIRRVLGKDETWAWKPKVCQKNLRNVWKWHYARCKISCWPKLLGQKHLWANMNSSDSAIWLQPGSQATKTRPLASFSSWNP